MKKALTYSAGLIALYLAVANQFTKDVIKNGADGGATIIKAFQGRA